MCNYGPISETGELTTRVADSKSDEKLDRRMVTNEIILKGSREVRAVTADCQLDSVMTVTKLTEPSWVRNEHVKME
jgi:hypothetical protein